MITPSTPLPPSGDLAQSPPLALYTQAALSGLSGLLSLELSDRAIELHFRRGNLEFVGSSHPEDDVGRFLSSQGLVTSELLQRANAEKGRFGGELLGALLGLGLLNPNTAFGALAQRAALLLQKGLCAERGRFRFEPVELPAHRALPLGSRWAMLMEAVRKIPLAELKRRLQPKQDLPLSKSEGKLPLSELRLSPKETRVLAQVDGKRSLRWLAQELPQEVDSLFRLAFVLAELGALSYGGGPVEPPAPPSAAAGSAPTAGPAVPGRATSSTPVAAPTRTASSTPASTSGSTAPPQDFETQIAELRQRAKSFEGQNYFERLGVTAKADSAAVKAAYFKLAKSFHPDTVPAGSPETLAQLKSQLFGVVGEAYRTLADERSRADYAEELLAGTHGEKVDISQIFQAEENFQKACVLVKLRRFKDAVALLDAAIKLNPNEGEFYAWRGHAFLLSSSDRKAALGQAKADIQESLRRNERCAPAHYFMGQIAKLTADTAAELKHFRRAVEIKPDHVDAQRELRRLGGK